MNFADELEQLETPETELVTERRPLAPTLSAANGLKQIEDELLADSLGVVSAAARFADIDPEDPNPPQEWIERLGPEEAAKAHRVARYALMPNKDAPVGLQMAQKVALGILTNRSRDKSGPQTLNVSVVQMTVPIPNYKILKNNEE